MLNDPTLYLAPSVPEGIRTPDPRLRRPLLYPAELQTHALFSEKRVMGIEPTYPAWKAGVLPLNYTCAVGVTRFELAASWSQTRRSSQTEPRETQDVQIPQIRTIRTRSTQKLVYYKILRLSTKILIKCVGILRRIQVNSEKISCGKLILQLFYGKVNIMVSVYLNYTEGRFSADLSGIIKGSGIH